MKKMKRVLQKRTDGSVVKDCNGKPLKGYLMRRLRDNEVVLDGFAGYVGDWTLEDVEAWLQKKYEGEGLDFDTAPTDEGLLVALLP